MTFSGECNRAFTHNQPSFLQGHWLPQKQVTLITFSPAPKGSQLIMLGVACHLSLMPTATVTVTVTILFMTKKEEEEKKDFWRNLFNLFFFVENIFFREKIFFCKQKNIFFKKFFFRKQGCLIFLFQWKLILKMKNYEKFSL